MPAENFALKNAPLYWTDIPPEIPSAKTAIWYINRLLLDEIGQEIPEDTHPEIRWWIEEETSTEKKEWPKLQNGKITIQKNQPLKVTISWDGELRHTFEFRRIDEKLIIVRHKEHLRIGEVHIHPMAKSAIFLTENMEMETNRGQIIIDALHKIQRRDMIFYPEKTPGRGYNSPRDPKIREKHAEGPHFRKPCIVIADENGFIQELPLESFSLTDKEIEWLDTLEAVFANIESFGSMLFQEYQKEEDELKRIKTLKKAVRAQIMRSIPDRIAEHFDDTESFQKINSAKDRVNFYHQHVTSRDILNLKDQQIELEKREKILKEKFRKPREIRGIVNHNLRRLFFLGHDLYKEFCMSKGEKTALAENFSARMKVLDDWNTA